MDDSILYRQLKAGDEAALEELVGRYHHQVFAFLFRLTGDHSLADDLAQDVFIRLITYRGEAPTFFRGWMFTLARNLAYDHFRSGGYRHEQRAGTALGQLAAEREANISPEGRAMNTDVQREVVAALQALPPEQREVVILRFYHNLPLGEIAAITNAPLGTVKSRLFHALKKLKEQLILVGEVYG